jgi:hypothetical protein
MLASVIQFQDRHRRVLEKTPAMTAPKDTDIQQAIAVIGLIEDSQPDGITRDIADKHQPAAAEKFLAVDRDFHRREIIIPECPPERPEISQMADMSFADGLNAIDTLPSKPMPQSM